jgi:hypothetical protein
LPHTPAVVSFIDLRVMRPFPHQDKKQPPAPCSPPAPRIAHKGATGPGSHLASGCSGLPREDLVGENKDAPTRGGVIRENLPAKPGRIDFL